MHVLRSWREWLVEQAGDPFADCGRPWFDKLPTEEQLARIRLAEKLADQLKPHKFSITSDVSQAALQSLEGAAQFGRLMLQEHHPDIDDNTAFQVWLAAGPELGKVLGRAQGKVPGGNGAAPVEAGEVQPLSLIGTGSISS